MGSDYIPKTEIDRRAWLVNFANQLSDSGISYGFTAPEVNAIGALVSAYDGACGSHIAAVQAADAAKETKDAAMTPCVAAVRDAAGRLQSHPLMDDAKRVTYGLTVPDSEPTPVGPPTTRPVLQSDTSAPGRITTSFADEGTPTKKAKPAGVSACLLQGKKGGTAPASDADWPFLAIDSSTPHLWVFDSADAGQPVWIRACWINSRQEQGPWSNVLATRVPG